MHRYNTSFSDDIFIKYLETGSGDEHPFFGFTLNKKDAESIDIEPHRDVMPKEGTKYDVIKIKSGNLLYIPELPGEEDIYYVVSVFGTYGMEIEVKPRSEILTGDRLVLNFRDSLDEKGVYESITHNNRLMDIPSVAPFSDYYLGKLLGRSEDFLVDLI